MPPPPAPKPRPTRARPRKPMAAQVAQRQAEMTPPPPTDDDVRVPYVPEVVKDQMRDEIKQDVMAQAKAEHWAAPNAIPDWVPRFRFTGDIRVRYEGDFFPNATTTPAPFQISMRSIPARRSTSPARTSPRSITWTRIATASACGRASARRSDLQIGFTAGIRLATGENNSPVTENQTLGLANKGQGGNFSKYAIWLDRAFLKYEIGGTPDKDFSLTVGRLTIRSSPPA